MNNMSSTKEGRQPPPTFYIVFAHCLSRRCNIKHAGDTKVAHKLPPTFCIVFVRCLSRRRNTSDMRITKLLCNIELRHTASLMFLSTLSITQVEKVYDKVFLSCNTCL